MTTRNGRSAVNQGRSDDAGAAGGGSRGRVGSGLQPAGSTRLDLAEPREEPREPAASAWSGWRPRLRTEAHWRAVDRLRCLVDDVGDAWAFGPTSAALDALDGGFVLGEPFHLVVEHGRRVHRHGVIVHVTRDLPLIDRRVVDGVPCTSATRALIDLAPTCDQERLTAAIDSALRDGLTSEDFLHRRLAELRCRGRQGPAEVLRALTGAEAIRGGHSWLEREFLRLVAGAGLPMPHTQVVVGRRRNGATIRVDCRFTGTPVVVELLGYAFHRSQMEMQRDLERMNQMLLEGLTPIQFTYLDVVTAPQQLLTTLRSALRRAA